MGKGIGNRCIINIQGSIPGLQASAWSRGHEVDTGTGPVVRSGFPSSLNQLGLNVTSSFCKTTWANILFRLRAAWRTCKF